MKFARKNLSTCTFARGSRPENVGGDNYPSRMMNFPPSAAQEAAALTTAQVASLAGIPAPTLHRWVQSGRIAPTIAGRRGRRYSLLWSVGDAVAVRCMARLRSEGLSGQKLRKVQEALLALGDDFAGCTVFLVWPEVFHIAADGTVTALLEAPGQTALTAAELLAGAQGDAAVLPVSRWQAEALEEAHARAS